VRKILRIQDKFGFADFLPTLAIHRQQNGFGGPVSRLLKWFAAGQSDLAPPQRIT
jgi:hypothetical protein